MPNYRYRALARAAKGVIGLMAAPSLFPVPAQSQTPIVRAAGRIFGPVASKCDGQRQCRA
jgi:hypothetical protein